MSEIYQMVVVVLGGYALAAFFQKVIYPAALKPRLDFKMVFRVDPYNKSMYGPAQVLRTLTRLRHFEEYLKSQESELRAISSDRSKITSQRFDEVYNTLFELTDVIEDTKRRRERALALALRFGFGQTCADGKNPIADAGFPNEIPFNELEEWAKRRQSTV